MTSATRWWWAWPWASRSFRSSSPSPRTRFPMCPATSAQDRWPWGPRAGRRAGRRNPLPRALSLGLFALLHDLRAEHGGGGGPAQAQEEVPLPMRARYKGFWSGGEPFVWLTGGALTL